MHDSRAIFSATSLASKLQGLQRRMPASLWWMRSVNQFKTVSAERATACRRPEHGHPTDDPAASPRWSTSKMKTRSELAFGRQ